MSQVKNELTLGEKRVKVDFNVTGSLLVDEIKKSTADLINKCEDLRIGIPTPSSERQRLLSLAQTKYEEAAMYAVKANFTE